MSVRLHQPASSREIFYKIDNIDKKTKKALQNALSEVGMSNVRRVRDLMSEKKTGRRYSINGGHQASAPGEAPAIISRNLYKNTDYTIQGPFRMEIGYKTVGGQAPYGKFLELGTERIKIRPAINRAVKEEIGNSQNAIVKAIGGVI